MSIDREQAWSVLTNSAAQWAENRNKHFGAALSQAAKDWAAANGYVLAVGRSAASSGDAGLLLPNYGRSKGLPVKGASKQDLEFYRNGCERSLADPAKARWHDKERALLAAIDAELGAHGDGPPATQEGMPF